MSQPVAYDVAYRGEMLVNNVLHVLQVSPRLRCGSTALAAEEQAFATKAWQCVLWLLYIFLAKAALVYNFAWPCCWRILAKTLWRSSICVLSKIWLKGPFRYCLLHHFTAAVSWCSNLKALGSIGCTESALQLACCQRYVWCLWNSSDHM